MKTYCKMMKSCLFTALLCLAMPLYGMVKPPQTIYGAVLTQLDHDTSAKPTLNFLSQNVCTVYSTFLEKIKEFENIEDLKETHPLFTLSQKLDYETLEISDIISEIDKLLKNKSEDWLDQVNNLVKTLEQNKDNKLFSLEKRLKLTPIYFKQRNLLENEKNKLELKTLKKSHEKDVTQYKKEATAYEKTIQELQNLFANTPDIQFYTTTISKWKPTQILHDKIQNLKAKVDPKFHALMESQINVFIWEKMLQLSFTPKEDPKVLFLNDTTNALDNIIQKITDGQWDDLYDRVAVQEYFRRFTIEKMKKLFPANTPFNKVHDDYKTKINKLLKEKGFDLIITSFK